MVLAIFNTNMFKQFEIKNYNLNQPVNLSLASTDNNSGKFLSYNKTENKVFFSNDQVQKWIIESDDSEPNTFYIKGVIDREDSAKYLGSPLANSAVYLYTSKNIFTKWSITHNVGDTYTIKYIGKKFDNELINIVAISSDHKWLIPYADIVKLYTKEPKHLECSKFLHNKLECVDLDSNDGAIFTNHIINSYGNLPLQTIFLSPNIFLHVKTFLTNIDTYYENKYFRIFEEQIETTGCNICNAQFSSASFTASKENILENSKESYEKILRKSFFIQNNDVLGKLLDLLNK